MVEEYDRLALLAETSRCLASSLDYEATLTTVAGMSLPYLQAWCIVDVVMDDPPGAIRRVAVVHPDPRLQDAASELSRRFPPSPDDFIGVPRVIRTGQPEIVVDVSDDALAASARSPEHLELLRTLGVSAYVTLPMVARGRTVGAMTFVAAEPGRRFEPVDVAMAQDLAHRAAMALDNARLYGAAVKAREETEAARVETGLRATHLQTFSTALSRATTEGEVAEAVVIHATAVFGAVGAVIARVSPDGEHLEIMSAGAMPDEIRDEWRRFRIGTPAPLADVARTGVPLFLESREAWAARYPDMTPVLDATGHQANVVAPLVVHGKVLGVIGAAFDSPRSFSEDDRALALAVAQQAAQALERARLFEAERKARAEAEVANRHKGEFLASMSHELRTPLNAIAGYTQLLEMELHGPITDAQHGALTRITVAQRHLLRLVNDVLNFERLHAGKLEYEVGPVRLTDVVADVEPLIGPQLRAKSLTYSVDLPSDCWVLADRDKLVQVLLNLVSNAVKFTPAGGRVTLDCAERADGSGPSEMVFLRVTDSGVGIPHAKLSAVFEPFVQVDSTLAGRSGGAGLGLAISRDLARGMGGDVRVRSELGAGASFTIALPRSEPMRPAD
jgi:signal transduction histidine kinase